MLSLAEIEERFNENGYVVLPKLLDLKRINELQVICERVLHQWLQNYPNSEKKGSRKNVSCLTEPHHFLDRREELHRLLDLIADEWILSILDRICSHRLLFHDAQYFFNPISCSRAADWHRDAQAIAPRDSVEKARIANSGFIRANIAFITDDNLEIVPGSHRRWDTPEELEIRRGLHGKSTSSSEMPFATRVRLERGDAVFFDGYSIHRGRYLTHKPRRTLALLYGSCDDWCTPPSTCFLDPNVLNGLPPQKQAFFREFAAAYKDRECWQEDES